MNAQPLVARARSLGGTNLVVSGILTDYKELSCNNSIWNLDAVRFANVQERVLSVSTKTGAHAYLMLIHMDFVYSTRSTLSALVKEHALRFVPLRSLPLYLSAQALTGIC